MTKKNTTPIVNALFGGTFDPPHFGHLLPLLETADIAGLSNISLLPANVPVFKKDITQSSHRIAMTQLLCAEDSRLNIDLSEFLRGGLSYTIDTLIHFKKQHPGQVIIFIIGLDSLTNIHTWERWQLLFEYCHVLVMLRPSQSAVNDEIPNIHSTSKNVASKLYNFYTSVQEFDDILGPSINEKTRLFLLSKLAQTQNDSQCINLDAFKDIIGKSTTGNLWFIKNQVLPLSSTAIRQDIKAGKSISNSVPTSISDYINKHQLYTT